jgi:hypothetical protein
MKHAGPEALDQLEPILEEIRRLDGLKEKGLKEKKRGSFYSRSGGFLHFHEDPAGFFADLKVGDDYVRFPINSKTQTQTFLRRVASALNSAKNARRKDAAG